MCIRDSPFPVFVFVHLVLFVALVVSLLVFCFVLVLVVLVVIVDDTMFWLFLFLCLCLFLFVFWLFFYFVFVLVRACPNRIEIENRTMKKKNRALMVSWFKHVPLRFFRFRKKSRSTPDCQKSRSWELRIEKQVESTNSNNAACPTGQRSHVRISHQDLSLIHISEPTRPY